LPQQQAVQDSVVQLLAAAGELQRLRLSVVTGAAAATPIALAGIATADVIIGALLFKDPAAATTASVVALTASIPSAGNVQFVEATNAAAGDRVVVAWFDKTA
jgi:hypothetical protein